MQPWLIVLDAVERMSSRGWANLQTLSEALALAQTWRPGVEPSSLKGTTKQEVCVCNEASVFQGNPLGRAPRSVTI